MREGISDGRESSFQEHFDIGFREGFKNGFALAKYKGLLAYVFGHVTVMKFIVIVLVPIQEKII